jgi:T5orf172 domain.
MKSVYVISNGEDNYKIGVSKKPSERINAIRNGNSKELALVYQSVKCFNAYELESKIHSLFSKDKVRGEWFRFENVKEKINLIKKIIKHYGKQEPYGKNKGKGKDRFKEVFGINLEDVKTEYEEIQSKTQEQKIENERVREYLNYIICDTHSEYADIIYKTLFGEPKESIREYLTSDQLKDVESMEMLVSSLINCGWGYEQIKNFIQENNTKQLAG